jgi:hypothetical protein
MTAASCSERMRSALMYSCWRSGFGFGLFDNIIEDGIVEMVGPTDV